MSQERLWEIERRLSKMRGDLDSALSRLTASEQLTNKLSGSMGLPRSGESTNRIYQAVVTTAIPTGTHASPSTTGAATITRWSGSAWAADASPTTIRNRYPMPSSLPVGRTIFVVKLEDGNYWLLTSSCS